MLRAIGQLDDPAFLGAVLRGVAGAVAGLVALAVGLAVGGARLAEWLGVGDPAGMGAAQWGAAFAGAAGAAVLGLFLFVPLATAIATLFVDRIAEAVERRHYPDLPPGVPANVAAQVWDGVMLALSVLAAQVVAVMLSLMLPVVGLALGWLVASWAIGRGLFMAVAMRRATRAEALVLYRSRALQVLIQGGLVAAAGLVPVLNLVAPVVGLAAMVHVLGRSGPMGGRIGAPGGLSGQPPA